VNRTAVLCICLISIVIFTALIRPYISPFANVSGLSAHEVIDHLNEFQSSNPDHPAIHGIRGWGMPANNRVNVYHMNYSREQIALFRNEVINSPLIRFHDIRGLGNVRFSEPIQTNPYLENVSMVISEINKDEGYMIVTIINDTEYELVTGYAFAIETFAGRDWWLVPGNYTFLSVGIMIDPFESESIRKSIYATFGSLEPGGYRIRKDVYRWIDRTVGEGIHDLFADFYWE